MEETPPKTAAAAPTPKSELPDDPKLSDILKDGIGSTFTPLWPGMLFKMVTSAGIDARLFEVKTVRKRDLVIRALPIMTGRTRIDTSANETAKVDPFELPDAEA